MNEQEIKAYYNGRILEEIQKMAPENHRDYHSDTSDLWCPWAFKYVAVRKHFTTGPVCSGCLRPVHLGEARSKYHFGPGR